MDDAPNCFWAYILEDQEGRFYIGHTDNLDRRVAEHNTPEKIGTKYTHKKGPWRLVWHEEHETRSDAMRRERFIKSRKSSAWISKYLLNR